MKATRRDNAFPFGKVLIICTVIGSLAWCSSSEVYAVGSAQEKKIMREFRGVRLGLNTDGVHAALGNPASSAEGREEYTFDGENQITIHYANGEVKAIQIFYLDTSKAPDWGEVIGDAEIEEMANGAKAARKVVSAEKFWVTMYRSKDGSSVRITISR